MSSCNGHSAYSSKQAPSEYRKARLLVFFFLHDQLISFGCKYDSILFGFWFNCSVRGFN